MAERAQKDRKQGEPVAPTSGEIEREIDPTRKRRPQPDDEPPRAPDMGGEPRA